jgi:hypothetical protein
VKVALLAATPRITDAFLRRVELAYTTALPAVETAWAPVYPEIGAAEIRVVSSAAELVEGDVPILFVPTIDEPGDLAYHYLAEGLPYALVLADDKQSFPSVEQSGWHELVELRVDPLCNRFDPAGFAIEIADPLQDDGVPQDIGAGSPVLLSPWVLPTWFGLGPASGPFDSAELLQAEHALRPGGYAQVRAGDGSFSERYGERWPGHPAHKWSPYARRMRRRAKASRCATGAP